MTAHKRMILALAAAAAAGTLLTGCTRSQMNYQIAEAIGTDGKYPGNEPVETPKMKAQRLLMEESESDAAALDAQLGQAQTLMSGYYYDEATAVLDGLPTEMQSDSRVSDLRAAIAEGQNSLTEYSGDIPHLCFPTLIADSSMAFDGDDLAGTYNSSMVTCDEFREILQSLYENSFVLIDIHDIAGENESGTFVQKTIQLPSGKKPVVISQDNLDYSAVRRGDGIATKLVLNGDGEVKALYTDDGGHDLSGDYDLIPILDSFVEEHPDFSYRGAKGIVSVSGSNGVFGYSISGNANTSSAETLMNGTASEELTKDQTAVKDIADTLRENGWSIASAGYSHVYMNDLSESAFAQEMNSWQNNTAKLTGKSDILFFPYGAEVQYPGSNLSFLLQSGFSYFCGLWGDRDYLEIGDGYMRQTRRFVDGYTLQNAPQYFSDFFDAGSLLDSNRGK